MHIAIEGMDGVGKTTTCELLAERLGFKFVEKPLANLFCDDNMTDYLRIRDKVNASENRLYTSWFYALSNIYLYEQYSGNIISDRHIVSNYAWSGTAENKCVYDLLVSQLGVPTLTVILYAPSDVVEARLKKRNINDTDLCKVSQTEHRYEKMIYICENYKFPYIIIDTSCITALEAVDRIISKLNEIT